jgi:hypothetical protein
MSSTAELKQSQRERPPGCRATGDGHKEAQEMPFANGSLEAPIGAPPASGCGTGSLVLSCGNSRRESPCPLCRARLRSDLWVGLYARLRGRAGILPTNLNRQSTLLVQGSGVAGHMRASPDRQGASARWAFTNSSGEDQRRLAFRKFFLFGRGIIHAGSRFIPSSSSVDLRALRRATEGAPGPRRLCDFLVSAVEKFRNGLHRRAAEVAEERSPGCRTTENCHKEAQEGLFANGTLQAPIGAPPADSEVAQASCLRCASGIMRDPAPAGTRRSDDALV